jgi:hypothetical protein
MRIYKNVLAIRGSSTLTCLLLTAGSTGFGVGSNSMMAGDYFAAITVLLSRRDCVMVARYEVPGNRAQWIRPVGYGMIGVTQGVHRSRKDQSGKQLLHFNSNVWD